MARIDGDGDVRKIAQAFGLNGPHLRAKLCAAVVEKISRHMDEWMGEAEKPEVLPLAAEIPPRPEGC